MEQFQSFSLCGNHSVQEASREFAISQECRDYLASAICDSEKYAREAYNSAFEIRFTD